jgi:hypothetical protein
MVQGPAARPRPLVQRMLDDEIDGQKRLKAELAQGPKTSA